MRNLYKLSLILIVAIFATTESWSQSLTTNTSSINLSAKVGETVEQQITVKVLNLPALATLSSFNVKIEGANNNQFSVLNTETNLITLLTSLLTGGQNITVKYTPTAVGTHTANVAIEASILGLTAIPLNLSIPITGIATAASVETPAVLSSSASSLSFSAQVGQTTNQKTTVTLANLPASPALESFHVTLSGANSNQFSVSSASPTLGDLTSGVYEVPVTYSPTAAGSHTATATIEAKLVGVSTAIQTQVTLNGTATAVVQTPAVLTSSASNLSFSAQVGQTNSQKATISISNLPTSPILESFNVTLSGTNSNQFSVSNTSATLSELISGGHDISINYTPTAIGSHTATVIIEAKLAGISTATQIQISLSGTATSPSTPFSATLSASPSSVSLSSKIGETETQDIDISILNLPILSTLTAFTANIQGANSNQFTVTGSSASLIDILQELTSGNHKITVNYSPTAEGTHTANLVVSASFLGVASNIIINVPLSGSVITTPVSTPPAVTSTTPQNGATNVVTSSSISLLYDKNITVADTNKITINGSVVKSAVSSGASLNLTPANNLAVSTTYTVLVKAGAVRDSNNNLTTSDYSFSFQTASATNNTDSLLLVSVSPDSRNAIIKKTQTADIALTFTFNHNIANVDQSKISVNSGHTIKSVTINSANSQQVSVIISGTVTSQTAVTITVAPNAFTDTSSNIFKGTYSSTYTIIYSEDGGELPSGNESVDVDKVILSETFYTISGAQVNRYALQRGSIYIKRIVYEDGSVENIKMFHSKYE